MEGERRDAGSKAASQSCYFIPARKWFPLCDVMHYFRALSVFEPDTSYTTTAPLMTRLVKEGAHLYRVQNKPSVMEQSLWWQEHPATSACWWTCREGHFWVNKRVLIYHTQLFDYTSARRRISAKIVIYCQKSHTHTAISLEETGEGKVIYTKVDTAYNLSAINRRAGVRPQMAWKCFPNEVLQGCHVKKEIWQD